MDVDNMRVEGEDMLEENDKQNVGVRPAGNGNWCEQDKWHQQSAGDKDWYAARGEKVVY